MSHTFNDIPTTDYDGYKLRETSSFTFNEPVTVLVGCNGAGKTTLMAAMQEQLNDKHIPYTKHYALESRDRIASRLTFSGDMDIMAALTSVTWASEGESIVNGFAYLANELGNFVFNTCKDSDEAWIFLDSLDSGLSIDNICEIIEFINTTVIGDKPENLDLNVVIAANAYEFARNFDCIDVQTGNHVTFTSYDEYRDFVLATKNNKAAYIDAGVQSS